jgi:hypothetical protein
MAAAVLTSCSRAEGQWRGDVKEQQGIKIVSNEGEGIEAGRVRESLKSLWTAGNRASGATFNTVIWVETDPAGNVYVLDHHDQTVTKFGPDGTRLGQFGGHGQQDGQLSKSRRFVWSGGKLYFANEGNGRIEVLGDDGKAFPSIQLADVKAPAEVFLAKDRFVVGRKFVPDGSFVHTYHPDWKLDRAIRPADPVGDRNDYLRSHNSICPAPDGVWIVYMLLNRIQKVGWDGKVLLETSRDLDWEFPKDAAGRVIPDILVHRACAVDPAGNLYVAYSNPENWKRGNEVFKFGPDGRLLQKAFTLPILSATMMRFDRQGNFWFSDGKTLTKAKIERTGQS